MNPDPPPPEDAEAFKAKRRGRNIALLIALLSFSAIFYAVTVVRILRP